MTLGAELSKAQSGVTLTSGRQPSPLRPAYQATDRPKPPHSPDYPEMARRAGLGPSNTAFAGISVVAREPKPATAGNFAFEPGQRD